MQLKVDSPSEDQNVIEPWMILWWVSLVYFSFFLPLVPK